MSKYIVQNDTQKKLCLKKKDKGRGFQGITEGQRGGRSASIKSVDATSIALLSLGSVHYDGQPSSSPPGSWLARQPILHPATVLITVLIMPLF